MRTWLSLVVLGTALGRSGAAAAADEVAAPVTAVTVYGDRARVTRTATLTLPGKRTVLFPVLGPGVDPATLRLESAEAEIETFEIVRVTEDELPVGEARQLLDALEKLDVRLQEKRRDLEIWRSYDLASHLHPDPPPANGLRPPPRVDGRGWGVVLGFARGFQEKLHTRAREIGEELFVLERQRRPLAERAQKLTASGRRDGWRVRARISGQGPTRLHLSAMTRQARWQPAYDVRFEPREQKVTVYFAALVSQETGEDWERARLTVSTAAPGQATTWPRLPVWKIGEQERFIPTPRPQPRPVPPQLAPVSVAAPAEEREQLRKELLARTTVPAVSRRAGQEEQRISLDDALPSMARRRAMIEQEPLETRVLPLSHATASEMQRHVADLLSERGQVSADDRTRTLIISDVRQRIEVAEELIRTLDVPTPAPGHPAQLTERRPPAPRPPPPPPARPAPAPAAEKSVDLAETVVSTAKESGSAFRSAAVPTESFGLRPPGRRGDVPPPASFAGGYDLVYRAAALDTVRSGQGTRRVALFARSFPVGVERRLYPALSGETYLVGVMRTPAGQPLPEGDARLFVGGDPAGTAHLPLVAGGQTATLPLGIDAGVKAIRHVDVETRETGVIAKDEVSTYRITIEFANPYATPMAVRVYDQVPLAQDKHVKVKRVSAEPRPYEAQDAEGQLLARLGGVEWRLVVPARARQVLRLVYTLERPKGYRLRQ